MKPERWTRIEELLGRVLEVPAEDRQAYLERVSDDPDVLREVRELLTSYEDDPSFLEDPVSEIPRPEIGVLEWDDVPERIGHYRILRPIGRGGMGNVFLALREEPGLRQEVALKVMRRGLDTDDFLRRFHAERQILATLRHPNITRLYDAGATEDGRPYFVMEHIEGLPITEFCDERRLSIRERLDLFLEVCGAVHHAHLNLVVHRDLKPTNVLVPEDGVPRLLDFGIAKALDPGLVDASAPITATPLRVMTPGYASPEQVRGEEITASSDVYALGLILYELLTGHLPYRAGTASSPAEIERLVTRADVPLPSVAVRGIETVTGPGGSLVTIGPERVSDVRGLDPGRHVRTLRGDLDNIVLTALRRDPAARYASAEHLAADIRRHLDGLPVSARPSTWAYRARKFVGRRHAGVAAATVTLAAIVVAGAALLRDSPAAAGELDAGLILVSPFVNQTGDPGLDDLGARLAVRISEEVTGTGLLRAVPVGARSGAPGREAASAFVLTGAYRRAGDRLVIEGRVTSNETHELLRTVPPLDVAGALALDDGVARQFGDRSAGTLAMMLDPRTAAWSHASSQPGSFEAWRHFAEGLDHLRSNELSGAAAAGSSFRRAYEADTTFTLAMLWPRSAYRQSFLLQRPMVESLRRRRASLPPVDLALLDATYGQGERPVVEVMRDLVAIAPEPAWVIDLAGALTAANRPIEAARLLSDLEPAPDALYERARRFLFLTDALHVLGEYEEELAVALRHGRELGEDGWQLQNELRALSALGRVDEFERRWTEITATTGDSGTVFLRFLPLEELAFHGHPESAGRLADPAISSLRRIATEWGLDPDSTFTGHIVRILAAAGRLDEAFSTIDGQMQGRRLDEFRGNRIGHYGILAARSGRTEIALEALEALEARAESPSLTPRDEPFIALWRGLLTGHLGDRDRAVRLFREGVRKGLPLGAVGNRHLLESVPNMRGYTPFEEVLRPKG